MMHLLSFVLAALAVTRGLAAPVDTAVLARDDKPTIWAPALGHPSIPITPAMGHPDVGLNWAPALGHPSIPVTPALGGDLHLKRNEAAGAPEPPVSIVTPAMGHPSIPITPAMGHPDVGLNWAPALGHPSIPVTPAMGGDLHFKRNEAAGAPQPSASIVTPAMGHPDVGINWTPAMGHADAGFNWTPAMGHADEPVAWTPALGGDLHLKRNEPGKPITDHMQGLSQTLVNPWATRTAANAIPTWAPAHGAREDTDTARPWTTRTAANAIPTWLTRGPSEVVHTAANAIPTWLVRGPPRAD